MTANVRTLQEAAQSASQSFLHTHTWNFDGFWAAQGDLLGLHMVGFYTSLCGATWWHLVLIGVIFVELWSIRLVSRFEFVPFLNHFGLILVIILTSLLEIFVIALGSFWDHFGITLGNIWRSPCGHVWRFP